MNRVSRSLGRITARPYGGAPDPSTMGSGTHGGMPPQPVDPAGSGKPAQVVQAPARVKVTCVTPLGEEVASTS
jgi:hypothetical protein